MKRIISVLLVFFMLFVSTMPVRPVYAEDDGETVNEEEIYEEESSDEEEEPVVTEEEPEVPEPEEEEPETPDIVENVDGEDDDPDGSETADINATVVDSGECGIDGDNLTYTIYDDGSLVIIGEGDMDDFYVDGEETKESNAPWFGKAVTKATIKSGVTSIGKNAFYGMESLNTVTIADSVSAIWPCAFKKCTALKSVVIPSLVTCIDEEVFSECTSLTAVTIPNGVEEIKWNAFYECNSLKSLAIPASVCSIEDEVFSGCRSLTSISVNVNNEVYDSRNSCNAIIETDSDKLILGCMNTVIPNGVSEIGYAALSNCPGLTSITIPDSVEVIGELAFFGCTGLKDIIIPDSVTEIGEDAFSSCTSLKSAVVSGSLETIPPYMFDDCTSLESVYIPDSVTEIGTWAFIECVSLKSVYIPESVETIGNEALGWTISHEFIKGLEIYTGAEEEQDGWEEDWCSPGTKVHYGVSREEYESGGSEIIASGDCGEDATFVLYDNGLLLISGSGDMGGWASLLAPWYDYQDQIFKVKISDGITNIFDYSFYSCKELVSVDIPDTVTEIGEFSFSSCIRLRSVELPDGLEKIGNEAFFASGLKELHIPAGVTDIDRNVFGGCHSLESIDVDEENTTFDSRNDCNAIIETASDELIAGSQNSFIPEGITAIGDFAFNGRIHLKSIVIPDSVTSIGKYAFVGCESMESIYIPDSVTTIGAYAMISGIRHVYTSYPEDQPGWDPTWVDAAITVHYGVSKDQYLYGDIDPRDLDVYEQLEEPTGFWTSKPEDKEYDGTAQTQDLRVYDHNRLLKEGADYTLKYANNVNAGTASMTITGTGNFKGTLTRTFNIVPLNIDMPIHKVTYSLDTQGFIENGKVQKAAPIIIIDGVKLKSGKDYAVEYENPKSKNEGIYGLRVTLQGNYFSAEPLDMDYEIFAKNSDVKPISTLKITGVKDKTYDGKPAVFKIKVTDGKKVLTEGIDYNYFTLGDTDVGYGIVVIVPAGSEYIGIATKYFKISPLKLTAKNLKVEGLTEKEFTEEGVEQDGVILTCKDNVLEKDKDYTVTYKNNAKAGTATVTYKGIGNYSGSVSKKFKITKKAIPADAVAPIGPAAYCKGGAKPVPTVTVDGTELKLNKDFTLAYKNNTKLGTATVTVKGKGNYSGEHTLTFSVVPKDLSLVTVKVNDKVYSKKANGWKSAVTLVDTDGKTLKAGVDYNKDILYTYYETTQLEDGTVREAGEPVQANDIVPIRTPIAVTVSADTGTSNDFYYGTAEWGYFIIKADISKAKVAIPAQCYTGKEIRLDPSDIKVTLNKEQLHNGDFEIVSYSNNIEQGTATVTLQGIGAYGGTKTVTFKIEKRNMGITIHFSSNGGTGTMKDQVLFKDGALSKNTFKKAGHVFLGWAYKKADADDGLVDIVNKGIFVYDPKLSGSIVTLYAVWKEK